MRERGHWARRKATASGKGLCSLTLLVIGLAVLFWPVSGVAAESAPRPAIVPFLRLERIVRLAAAYRSAPAGTLICRELLSPPIIDGDLSEWPAPQHGETLSLGEGQALGGRFRLGWDASALYLAAEISDDIILPSTAEDPCSGDTLEICFRGTAANEQKEENLHSFFITATPTGPLLLNAHAQPVEETREGGALAVLDSVGKRVVELRLLWPLLYPLTPFGFAQGKPFSEGGIRLSVRLEDRDAPLDIEPASIIDTHEEETRLLFLSDVSKTPKFYLRLVSDLIAADESLTGVLLVDSPAPAVPLSLRLEILAADAEGRQQTKAAVSSLLRLEQALNAFRLYWDCSEEPEGDYFVRAAGSGPAGELFSLQSPFRIESRRSVWKTLSAYSQKLSIPSVLSRLQKASESAPTSPLKFAVLGDCREGEAILQQLLAEAAREGAQFAIFLGDLVSNGRSEEYLRLAELLENAPLPVLPLPGNHDYIGQGRSYYQHLFGPLNYSFDFAGFRFLLLDNAAERLSPSQLDWLESRLQTPLPKFVFIHMPPATISPWAFHSFSPGAERFTALMEKYRPSRVFVGHIHAYDRLIQNGVEYVLSGGAGAPLYPQLGPEAMVYHFLLVEAGTEGITESVVKIAWQKEPAKPLP